jgi:mevalonate kinase
MKWQIPAKTFLLGEYSAIAEGSAIVLTTTPYFELTITKKTGTSTIHPESPAGIWWQSQNQPLNVLEWHDPYNGIGGLGASSAQFLASYLASCTLYKRTPSMENMLSAYYQCAWTGKGLRPSGYDVIAQSHQGCVFINRKKNCIQSYNWPFPNLAFFLIHTGVKLATHHHLQVRTLPSHIDDLSAISDDAHQAIVQKNDQQFVDSINKFHHKLKNLSLVAEHSLALIDYFKSYPEVLGIKGCGALGADVLLLLTTKTFIKK